MERGRSTTPATSTAIIDLDIEPASREQGSPDWPEDPNEVETENGKNGGEMKRIWHDPLESDDDEEDGEDDSKGSRYKKRKVDGDVEL